MSNKLKIALAVAIVIAIGGSYYFPRVQTAVQNVVGSVTGPDDSFQCKISNGLETCGTRVALTTATSTPCWIKAPNATSTLLSAKLQLTVGSSTATTWRAAVATSSSSFESATKIGSWSLGSGAVASFFASTTEATVIGNDDTGIVISPNQYIGWKYTGSAVGDASKFTGFCSAKFEKF